MGAIRGLLGGLALAGIVTFAYEQKLYSTSTYLRTALDSLSKDMEKLRIRHDIDESPKTPLRVEKLPFNEQVKYQWNEQVLRGVNSLYTTQWSNLAQSAWNLTKSSAQNLKEKISDRPTTSAASQ